MFKAGYVALVGKPNAGKSSLINTLIGEKVAIISSKPQTTRNNILGILTKENYQIVFVDTPGVHHSKNSLDKSMMKSVRSAISGVDLILYLIDGTKYPDEEEIDYINHLSVPVIIVKTKNDLNNQKGFKYDIDISSKKSNNIDKLIELILSKLPTYEFKNYLYDPEFYTDKSLNFIVSEEIREKILNILYQEVPHGVAVEVIKFEEKDDLVNIDADIICEQERHKGIIIGKGGNVLKKVGVQTREQIEKLLNKKVFLNLFVRVEQDWRNKPQKIKNLGY